MKIGIMELVVIFIVALFAFGPDKLPLYAKKLGEALAQFRKYSSEVTKDIKESIVEPLEEAQRPLREAMEPLAELDKEVKDSVKEVKDSFANIGKPSSKKKEPAPAPEAAAEVPQDDPHDALRQEADAAARELEELGAQAAAPRDVPEQLPDTGSQPDPAREEPGPAEQTENEPEALEKEEIV